MSLLSSATYNFYGTLGGLMTGFFAGLPIMNVIANDVGRHLL